MADKLRIVPIMIVFALLISSVGFVDGSDSVSPDNPTRASGWLICVYMCADNNLESAGVEDINEMESAPASSSVDVVVLCDRYDGTAEGNPEIDDTSNGNWTDAKVFEISHDSDPYNITSTEVSDEGEINMGDPNVLVGFMDWAITEYNRDNVALILWDHGGGYSGVCFDDDSGDHLDDSDIDSALYEISQSHGNLSVVAFDACLMATIEVLYSVYGYADYMVASEESEPGDGYPYDLILDRVAADPTMNAENLSLALAEETADSYTDGLDDPRDVNDMTQSALNLYYGIYFLKAFQDLSYYIYYSLDYGDTELFQILELNRSLVEEFGKNPRHQGYDYDYVDVIDLFYDIGMMSTDVDLIQYILDMMEAYYDMLVMHYYGWRHSESYGLSLYFPESGLVYDDNYDNTLFASDFYWVDALKSYFGYNPNTAPRIDRVATTPNPFNYYGWNYLVIENTQSVDFSVISYDLDEDPIDYYWFYSYYDIEQDQWGELIELEGYNEDTVTYTPEEEEESSLILIAIASDGYLTDGCSWILIITDNTPPALLERTPEDSEINMEHGETITLTAVVEDMNETTHYLTSSWYVNGNLIDDEYEINYYETDYQDEEISVTYAICEMVFEVPDDGNDTYVVNVTVEDEEFILEVSWTILVIADNDRDGIADEDDPDDDNDGIPDTEDPFPMDSAGLIDSDGDGKPDVLNGTSSTGLVEDLDDDGDGVPDVDDPFPLDPAASIDTDGDGKPDTLNGISNSGLVEDDDDDGDGVLDTDDAFPLDPAASIDTDGDGKPDTLTGISTTGLVEDDDDDGDGVPDVDDPFPLDPSASVDTDGDGKPDTIVGTSTTGLIEDDDDDNDGVPDIDDKFPTDPSASVDTDNDGQPDEIDGESTTGLIEDQDDDGDGYPDSEDDYPSDPSKHSKSSLAPSAICMISAVAGLFLLMIIILLGAILIMVLVRSRSGYDEE
ncbi:MAG: clostripain-related cysteine peptidase [Thermoplasmatota archaeon]